MKLQRFRHSPPVRLEWVWALGLVGVLGAGCGSSSSGTGGNTGETTSGSGGSGTSSAGSGSTTSSGSAGSGSSPTSGSEGQSGSSGTTQPTQSGSGTPVGDDASSPTSDGAVTDDAGFALPDVSAPPSCVKGTVTPDEVIMLGDSYMAPPPFGDVGANIIAAAQKAGALKAGVKYREYYVAGAAVNNGAGTLNIPYQYNTSAKMDATVTNPKDIKVVIMDGGGNDVLIDQRSCLTDATEAALMADTACQNAVNGAGNAMDKLWKEMAADGVKQIVYYFYPHLDPAGGGDLPTPAPGVNLVDDEGAAAYQKLCCGSSFTATTTDYSCTGNGPGTQCIFVDTRPAFEGHVTAPSTTAASDYIRADHVHPTEAGSDVIAGLMWSQMVANCVAQ